MECAHVHIIRLSYFMYSNSTFDSYSLTPMPYNDDGLTLRKSHSCIATVIPTNIQCSWNGIRHPSNFLAHHAIMHAHRTHTSLFSKYSTSYDHAGTSLIFGNICICIYLYIKICSWQIPISISLPIIIIPYTYTSKYME